MKNEKEILEMYVAPNFAWFNSSFSQEGYVIATDGCVLIRIRQSQTEGEYINIERPNVKSVFKETTSSSILTICSINKMLSNVKKVKEVKYIGKDIKCHECNGEGTVLWEYRSYAEEFDCPVCNGTGYESCEKEVQTGMMIPDPEEIVSIFGKRFRVKYLSVLKKTMELMDITEITMKYNNVPLEQALFCFGENTEVLLMPCRNE